MTKLMARLSHFTSRRLEMRRRDVAAEHVDGDLVADLEVQLAGEVGFERNQRLALVVLRPPFAGDDARAPRHLVGIGEPAVAVEHPLRFRRRLDLLDRHVVEAHQPPAQHRRLLERRAGDMPLRAARSSRRSPPSARRARSSRASWSAAAPRARAPARHRPAPRRRAATARRPATERRSASGRPATPRLPSASDSSGSRGRGMRRAAQVTKVPRP